MAGAGSSVRLYLQRLSPVSPVVVPGRLEQPTGTPTGEGISKGVTRKGPLGKGPRGFSSHPQLLGVGVGSFPFAHPSF